MPIQATPTLPLRLAGDDDEATRKSVILGALVNQLVGQVEELERTLPNNVTVGAAAITLYTLQDELEPLLN